RERGRAAAVAVLDDPADPRTAALVRAALADLGPGDREILSLSVRHGLTPAEAGSVLGLSSRQAAARLARARDRVENAAAAVVLPEKARAHCPDLSALVESGPAGPPGPVLRKRLTRHIAGCEVCAEGRRRHVSAERLLDAIPIAYPPLSLRPAVLDPPAPNTTPPSTRNATAPFTPPPDAEKATAPFAAPPAAGNTRAPFATPTAAGKRVIATPSAAAPVTSTSTSPLQPDDRGTAAAPTPRAGGRRGTRRAEATRRRGRRRRGAQTRQGGRADPGEHTGRGEQVRRGGHTGRGGQVRRGGHIGRGGPSRWGRRIRGAWTGRWGGEAAALAALS
ncbi:sigma factor-like helix-turn-helix DNA-binding protein, partial [Microtetraspora niveoalba]|uniref:sigma factor-like helix-turn-helix DNA-binding protein n=1 Tax=Microtetraspora niveoalba TaxID=46175 RepID=UPI0024808292